MNDSPLTVIVAVRDRFCSCFFLDGGVDRVKLNGQERQGDEGEQSRAVAVPCLHVPPSTDLAVHVRSPSQMPGYSSAQKQGNSGGKKAGTAPAKKGAVQKGQKSKHNAPVPGKIQLKRFLGPSK